MLVGPPRDVIRNVRFVRIIGETTGDGAGIRVGVGGEGKRTEGVVFRDVTISRSEGSSEGAGITVDSEADDPARLLSDIRFGNVTVVRPKGRAFGVTSSRTTDVGAMGPVRNVSWISGGVVAPELPFDAAAIAVERLTNGLFEGLRVAGGDGGRPVVHVGGLEDAARPPFARNVAFVDVTVTDVRADKTGARFDTAANCAWVCGAVSAVPGAAATGLALTANAKHCTVSGADLAGVSRGFDLGFGALNRVDANRAGGYPDNGRRTPVQFGSIPTSLSPLPASLPREAHR